MDISEFFFFFFFFFSKKKRKLYYKSYHMYVMLKNELKIKTISYPFVDDNHDIFLGSHPNWRIYIYIR